MPDRGRLAQEWFERGSHDLETARLAYEGGGPGDTIALLAHQAIEKYLKGYLLYQGWKLRKTHDLRELVDKAIDYDHTFTQFLELAHRMTAHYLEGRYPPGPPRDYTRGEIAEILEQAEKLIARIREATK